MVSCADLDRSSVSVTNTPTLNPFFDVPLCVFSTGAIGNLMIPFAGLQPLADLSLDTRTVPLGNFEQAFSISNLATNTSTNAVSRAIIASIQKNVALPSIPGSLPVLKD